MPIQQPDRLCAVILTGGASRRMGADKAVQMWGGERAVDRVARLATAVGATRLVTAGPDDLGWPHAPDPAPLSGPVAGLLSALELLGDGLERALVLAVDAPTLTIADLQLLLEAGSAGASYDGFPLPMVLPINRLPADARSDWPLRRLVERAGLTQLTPDPAAATRLRGANTPEERDDLIRAAGWSDPGA